MKRLRTSALCPERTLARHPCPFALRYRRAPDHPEVSNDLRYRRARPGRSMAQLLSLCPLCLCVLCVQGRSAEHLPHHIEVRGPKAAFDTEDTEAQRTQRNFGYSASGLSKPFLRYLRTCRTSGPSIPQDDRGPFDTSGRTGVGGTRMSAQGSKRQFAAVSGLPCPIAQGLRSGLRQLPE